MVHVFEKTDDKEYFRRMRSMKIDSGAIQGQSGTFFSFLFPLFFNILFLEYLYSFIHLFILFLFFCSGNQKSGYQRQRGEPCMCVGE